MEIVFATGNKNKLQQISLMLDQFDLKSPVDYDIYDFEVEEDGQTLKENAYKKAKALFDEIHLPVFSDDTGLFVDALDGRPGVHAHRYASEYATYKDNRDKLLFELNGITNRDAHFETVICFIDRDGNDHYFMGELDGIITREEIGDYDFGYDQIFKPDGEDRTLGEMTDEEINHISHRSKAINHFKKFLEENYD